MNLPTYGDAVFPHPLLLIGPYLDRRTLGRASQVNRTWSATFSAELWANPVHIMMKTNRPFSSLYRFIASARISSLNTRKYVNSLDFRPLIALPQPRHSWDIIISENILSVEWIMESLHLFPSLYTIILDGLKYRSDTVEMKIIAKDETQGPTPLLLSTSHMSDLNSIVILQLPFFINTIFLDLSYSPRPSSWSFEFSRIYLPNLRVFKLRGLRLTDTNLPTSIMNTHSRLWSLDISENNFTDKVLNQIIAQMFAPNLEEERLPFPELQVTDRELYASPPAYSLRSSGRYHMNSNPPFRDDSKDFFPKHSTNLPEPYTYPTGLTHLHLSNCSITTHGLLYLLSSTNRLQSLDIGSTDFNLSYTFPKYTRALYLPPSPIALFKPFHVLRIHHSLITGIPTLVDTTTGRTGHKNKTKKSLIQLAESLPLEYSPFTPLLVPGLKILTLTAIPQYSTGPLVVRLASFLRACAEQEGVLRLIRESTNGRHHRAPPVLGGLKILRLEFRSCVSSHNERLGNNGASISGDQDADEFLKESERDFSFFGSEIEEMKGKAREGISNQKLEARRKVEKVYDDMVDVVEELKMFRRDPRNEKWGGKLELIFPT